MRGALFRCRGFWFHGRRVTVHVLDEVAAAYQVFKLLARNGLELAVPDYLIERVAPDAKQDAGLGSGIYALGLNKNKPMGSVIKMNKPRIYIIPYHRITDKKFKNGGKLIP